jgi:hypothetical protein
MESGIATGYPGSGRTSTMISVAYGPSSRGLTRPFSISCETSKVNSHVGNNGYREVLAVLRRCFISLASSADLTKKKETEYIRKKQPEITVNRNEVVGKSGHLFVVYGYDCRVMTLGRSEKRLEPDIQLVPIA